MKITYILHSGFSLELEGKTLLFDYYKGDLPDFDKQKPLYVFSSHRHHDHFTKTVFDLSQNGYIVKYILSSDIKTSKEGCDIIRAYPNDSLTLDDLKISTLKSTDEGVAFIIETEGVSIYHAGDLNLWIWDEESEEYNRLMAKNYMAQLELIKGRSFDIAFLPLDPRQEKDRERGLLAFLSLCSCSHIFPMHFWEDYSVIPSLIEHNPALAPITEIITHQGQEFEIKNN
ncbi:MAG: MBL fold metallo-hydrolase [Clostridiaceae bacterium]|nr:MBL fold metallo-hydrolase [Clostridiaceae bacterium]